MRALILCAGLGTRLRPLTDRLPKSLLPIVGKPLLELTLSHLKEIGVEEIAVNTHHLSQEIRAFLKSEPSIGSKISISHEPEILGTGGAIGKLKRFFQNEDSFILYNGDILTNLDLLPAIKKHQEAKPLLTMILHYHSPLNNVIINQEDEIIDLRGILGASSKSPHRCLAYTGISIVNREFLEYCPHRRSADLVEILLSIIRNEKGTIKGFIARNHYWQDIGTIEDYYRVHQNLLLEKKVLFACIPLPFSTIHQGEGTSIEEGVSIQGFCSIGKNSLIKSGAYLENCIIWDNTVVEGNEHLKNCIKSREMIYHVKL